MKQSFDNIRSMCRRIKLLLYLFNLAVCVGYGNIVPSIDIYFFNIISAEKGCKYGIFCHFGINLVTELFIRHTFNGIRRITEILFDVGFKL